MSPFDFVNKGLTSKCISYIRNAIHCSLLFFFLIFFNSNLISAQENFEVIENEESAKKINKSEKTSKKLIKKSSEDKTNNLDSTTSKASLEINSPTPNIYDYSQDDVAGINVLMMAVNSNDIQGVSFFSKAGGVLVNQKNIGGATALHIASREGFLEIAKILIENGADVNAIDNEGWTPLMRANINGHHEVVGLLVSKGVGSGGLNYTGESAIMHATLGNCDKCLNIMFEKINFLQTLNLKSLKEQITDSFIISRNRENPKIQGLLEAFLDRLMKVSPSVSNEEFKKKMTQDNSNIAKSKIIEELINKDQNVVAKKIPDNSQALLVADFIEKNNQEINLQKNNKQAEIDKKIQASDIKNKKITSTIIKDLKAQNIVDLNNQNQSKIESPNKSIDIQNPNSPKEINIKEINAKDTNTPENKSPIKFVLKKPQQDDQAKEQKTKEQKIKEENAKEEILVPSYGGKVFILKPPASSNNSSDSANDQYISKSDYKNIPNNSSIKFRIINELNNKSKNDFKSIKTNNSSDKLTKNNNSQLDKNKNPNSQNIPQQSTLIKGRDLEKKIINQKVLSQNLPKNDPAKQIQLPIANSQLIKNPANDSAPIQAPNQSAIKSPTPSPTASPTPSAIASPSKTPLPSANPNTVASPTASPNSASSPTASPTPIENNSPPKKFVLGKI